MANGNIDQISELLGSLLQRAGQFSAKGVLATREAFNTPIVSAESVDLLRQLSEQANKTSTGQQPTKVTGGAQAEAAAPQFDEKSLPPLQQETLKTVKRIRKEQVEEAAEQGMPLEDILNTDGLTPDVLSGTITPETRALTGQGAEQQPQGERNLLIKLFNLAGFRAPQEELGRREELSIKQENAIELLELKNELSAGGLKGLTPENAGKFNLLIDGSNATRDMANIFLDDPSKLGGLIIENKIVPGFLKSQTGRKLESFVERAIQAKTRIETGAALQPSELKSTKKRFLPRTGDSPKTAQGRMKPLFDFFEGSLRVADPTGIHRQRASGVSPKAGNLAERIQKEKAKRGL